MISPTPTVGSRIKALREGQKMSQEELGDLIGIPQQTVSKIESDDEDAISVTRLRSFATALQVSILELLGETGNNHHIGTVTHGVGIIGQHNTTTFPDQSFEHERAAYKALIAAHEATIRDLRAVLAQFVPAASSH